jgi:hypothetical protein
MDTIAKFLFALQDTHNMGISSSGSAGKEALSSMEVNQIYKFACPASPINRSYSNNKDVCVGGYQYVGPRQATQDKNTASLDEGSVWGSGGSPADGELMGKRKPNRLAILL